MAKVKEEQSSQQTKQVLAFSTRLRHDLKKACRQLDEGEGQEDVTISKEVATCQRSSEGPADFLARKRWQQTVWRDSVHLVPKCIVPCHAESVYRTAHRSREHTVHHSASRLYASLPAQSPED